jgi:hypothetical protein
MDASGEDDRASLGDRHALAACRQRIGQIGHPKYRPQEVRKVRKAFVRGLVWGIVCLWTQVAAADLVSGEEDVGRSDKYAGYESLIAQTHKRSLAARQRASRATVAKASYWIKGVWGDTIWSLAALYANEKVDQANARLLENSKAYLAAITELSKTQTSGQEAHAFEPGQADTPWAYFSLCDYVRILCLFRAESQHFPGRLKPETEAAMKEALWHWVKSASRVEDAGLDQLLVLQGTENHDLTKRPCYYLIAAVLKDDPLYKHRRYDDGHTVDVHFRAWSTYFEEWPRKRAMTGMWAEVGSNTYQKYSWPALFNLHDLSPDSVVKKRFAMLMDLAFIEEAQISIQGRRGGGRSRANYGRSSFESYKNLLYAPVGLPAGSSHSKVIETSRYQLPPAAILLRYVEFPTEKPFSIANRVLGELATPRSTDRDNQRLAEDSALVNYAWRTPHYLLGGTLQDPSLAQLDPATDRPVLKYSGISRQNRWCGVIFESPADGEVCAIYPAIERTRGGRPQHPFWSFQHRNVLLLQRVGRQPGGIGSYSTGKIGVRFHGKSQEKVEADGWIFASNGKAFAGVRFLDHKWQWNDTRDEAMPFDCHDPQCTSRVLIHCGDVDADGSFQEFRKSVLSNVLTVRPDKVEYRAGAEASPIEFFRYDVNAPDHFTLPRVDGVSVELRPTWTYRSPYLNGQFGSDRITVTVGPIRQVYDFGESAVSTLGDRQDSGR